MKNRQLTQQQIRAYAHYLQMEEKSGATMEKYLRDIQAFACWLDGRDISKELTSEWKGHLISQDYAPDHRQCHALCPEQSAGVP